MKNVVLFTRILLIFIWISSCDSIEEKYDFREKTFKILSKHSRKCPKKLQQQPLQEVCNHGNYVKNDFCIKNRERLLANVDGENNVSTAKVIFTNYDERMQSENNNNNDNYVRCLCGKLCKGYRGLRAHKRFSQVFDSFYRKFIDKFIETSSTEDIGLEQSNPSEHCQT